MKYWSQTFIPTLKESPADAEIASHKLLLRAGLVRKLGAGLYTFMPAGLRTLRKIMDICREEIDREGGIELAMPHVHPVENWQDGPRWAAAREIMYRVDHAGDQFLATPRWPRNQHAGIAGRHPLNRLAELVHRR